MPPPAAAAQQQQQQPSTIDFAHLQRATAAAAERHHLEAADPRVHSPPSLASLPPMRAPPQDAAPELDSFVPHRPPATADTAPVYHHYIDSAPRAAPPAHRSTLVARLLPRRRRRRSRSSNPAASLPRSSAASSGQFAHSPTAGTDDTQDAHYFGSNQHDDPRDIPQDVRGEEVLLRFLKNTLGPKAHNLAIRLMNKTPITTGAAFSYVIHQATEDSDLDIIRRDLSSGRLYQAGVRMVAGAWCNLLLGDRFQPGTHPRQRHELTYRRSSCSCILCRVRLTELVDQQMQASSTHEQTSETTSTGLSAELLSTMSSVSRTPTHSAMANFVVKCRLPSNEALRSIGASSSSRELEIGSVVRLNYRASAKLKFTEEVSELFGHLAYTGPISHEEVYRRVTTIGVHYYLYNKGKKERKVYIQGQLIRLPVQVGVVKLGTQPMYFDELGATFCLHRKQIMSIYVGEIVLEGNSLGSFIKTGIRYYIGFGEERGVCPVYPNKALGKARKLGINELLLHHHMVDDLEVRCL